MIKAFVKVLFLLFVLTQTLNAQSSKETEAYNDDKYENQFESMLEQPEKWSSEDRTGIYLKHASTFLEKGVDSSFQVYREMALYGRSIKDSLMEGIAYSSISFLFQMKGETRNSISYSLKAKDLLRNNPFRQMSSIRSLSGSYMKINDLDSARIYNDTALLLTYEVGDSAEFAGTFIQKARIFYNEKRFASSIETYQKALEFADKANSQLISINCHRDIAHVYEMIRDYKNAEFHISKGLDIAEQNGFKRSISSLSSLKALYKLKQSKFAESIQDFEKAIPYKKNKKINYTLFNDYAGIARAYIGINNLVSAKSYLDQATKILPKIENVKSQALYYNVLGHYQIAQRNPIAVNQFEKILSLSNNSNLFHFKEAAFKGLILYNKMRGDFRKAVSFQDSLLYVVKKMDNLAQENFLYDYESKYKKAVQDKEIDRLTSNEEISKLALKQKSNQLWLSLLGLLFAIALIAALYYFFSLKTKNNKLLTEKNDALSKALTTNKMLIKEIHHRVKNNLQVVSSLLNLQGRFEKDNTVLKAINTGKDRVQSMSLLHQNLYVNENLKSIKVKKYFTDLAENLVDGYPLEGKQVELELSIDDLEMDIDTVVPLGLIANELLTNSLKYAFKDQDEYKLSFELKDLHDKVFMRVRDNGPGLPFQSIPSRSKSMGMQLITSFAHKLKAEIIVNNEDGGDLSLVFDKIAVEP